MRSPRTPPPIAWPAIALLALGVRLVHLWQIHATPVFTRLFVDANAYDTWARELASGHWIGTTVFYQAPLYPYFLGVLYATVGRDLVVVRVVQAALGAAGCVLLGLAGARLCGCRVGLVAATLLAVWPSAIFADGLIQKSALDTFLVCALVFALTTATRREEPRVWLVPGLVLGALVLTRENTLVLAPVLLAFVAMQGNERTSRVLAIGWLCLGLAVPLAPVVVRNWAVGSEVHLTTSQFGPNFFIGNNALATGGYRPLRYGRSDPRFERVDATNLAEERLGRPLTPGEVSRYWTGRALEFIATQPGRWLALLGRKAALFVNRIELGDAEDQYTYGDWSTTLAILTPVLNFGLLAPLAAAGLVLGWRRGPAVRLLAVLLATYAASVVATYMMARYRHPALPLLVLFAAIAVVELPRASGMLRLVAAGLALALAVPANWPIVSETSVRAATLYNIGSALVQEPDGLEAATDYLAKAVALDPTFALAHSNLGVALERGGRLDEARAALEHAVALEPARAEYVYNLAHVEAARGDVAAAVASYERTLALDPRHADAHANLGALLQGRGDLDGALGHYDAALAIDPRQPTALNDRGSAYAQQGKLDAAIVSFRAALAVTPADRASRENLVTALVQSGRREEGATELAELVAKHPDDADLRGRLGLLLADLGRPDEARPHLEAAAAVAERVGDHAAAARLRTRVNPAAKAATR